MDLSEICKPYGLNVRDVCDGKNLMDNTGESTVNCNIEYDRRVGPKDMSQEG